MQATEVNFVVFDVIEINIQQKKTVQTKLLNRSNKTFKLFKQNFKLLQIKKYTIFHQQFQDYFEKYFNQRKNM